MLLPGSKENDTWSLGALTRLDSYRLALTPAKEGVDPAAFRTALTEGGSAFVDLLLTQNLGAWWHHCLQAHGLLESLPRDVADALQQARMAAAARYLAQRTALIHIDQLFEAADISYAVMKGAHVRECAYPDPSLRLIGDIDLLVAPPDRRCAAHALLDEPQGRLLGQRAHRKPVGIVEGRPPARLAVCDPPGGGGRGHRLNRLLQSSQTAFDAGRCQPNAIRAALARQLRKRAA